MFTGYVAQVFGPGPTYTPALFYSPATTTDSINTWNQNPPQTFSNQYYNTDRKPVVNPGFSFTASVNNGGLTQTPVWNGNFQAASDRSQTYPPLPITTFYSANNNNTNSNQVSDYPQWVSISPLSPPSSVSPNGQPMGFPYFDTTTNQFKMGYVNILLTVPSYTNNFIQQVAYGSSTSINNMPLTSSTPSTYPTYLIMWYQRDATLEYPLPEGVYPIAMDVYNYGNNSQYQNFSTLSVLNTALGTSYDYLYNSTSPTTSLLVEEGWLEGVATSSSNTSPGVLLSGDTSGHPFYFAGVIPTNLDIQSTSSTAYSTSSWCSTTSSVNIDGSGNLVEFCSGNITFGSAINANNTGNQFWSLF